MPGGQDSRCRGASSTVTSTQSFTLRRVFYPRMQCSKRVLCRAWSHRDRMPSQFFLCARNHRAKPMSYRHNLRCKGFSMFPRGVLGQFVILDIRVSVDLPVTGKSSWPGTVYHRQHVHQLCKDVMSCAQPPVNLVSRH
jgi:hypothetical protein